MIPFNYHHLYYFYVIARQQSVSKAAAQLKISQPALSTQLRQLENFLNVRLFSREGKRLVLTEEGSGALAYAETIFNTGREFLDNIRDRGRAGSLKIQIGISDSIPKAFAEFFLKTLYRMEKGLHLTVYENSLEDMMADVKTHAIDLVLSDSPARVAAEEGIENHEIAKAPILFCAHRSIAGRYRNFPKDLDGAPVILPTAHSQIFHSVQQFFTDQGITPDVIAEIQDVELVCRLMLSKAGIAPLSEFMILNSAERKSIAVLDRNHRHVIWNHIYIITKKRRRMHPLVAKLLENRKTIFRTGEGF